MNIAVIRKECSFSRGGAERYCANFCRGLAERGHRVYVVAQSCDADIHPGIVHVPVRVNELTSSTRNFSFHHNSQAALAALQVERVFALSRTYPADAFRVSDPLHLSWMRIRYPGRLRHFMESLNPRHRTILALEKNIFRPENTRLIITNSRMSKEQVMAFYGYPEERVHVVYNGVDLEKFSPATDDGEKGAKGELQLLFVAQDFRRKGLEPLLRALAILIGEGLDCRLLVVGGDRAAPFQKQAQQLGIASRVEFAGATRQVEEYYRRADLMVFPTFADPFANVCLEALACGLPVVTTTSNGAAEIIDRRVDGYVIDGTRPFADQLVASIREFASLPAAVRQDMGKRARVKAEGFPAAELKREGGTGGYPVVGGFCRFWRCSSWRATCFFSRASQ
ncbi:MAG: glycosyltransferase family 4 protein [Desulfuromonadaceae bacterium]